MTTSPGSPPDPTFDALLAQAEPLRRRYAQATAAEGPSAGIDERIRAAAWEGARAGAAAPPRSWWFRLRVPVSIAAVLVLTTSAMLSMLHDTGERSLPDPSPSRRPDAGTALQDREATEKSVMSREAPVAAPRAESTMPPDRQSSSPAQAVARSGVPPGPNPHGGAAAVDERDQMAAMQGRSDAAAPAARADMGTNIPPSLPADAAPSSGRARIDVADGAESARAAPPASSPAAPAEAPSAAPTQRSNALSRLPSAAASPEADRRRAEPGASAKATPVDPDAWLERIRRQWADGEHDAARRQLAAFREAHPAHPIPKDFPVPLPPSENPDR